MRKISVIANVLFLGIILFMSCNKTDIKSTGKTSATSTGKPCPDCFDHTNTGFNGVNTQTAIDISNNYKTIDQPLLAINEVITDANSIWFSLESLKNFIWKIEQSTCDRHCSNSLNLGLRVYYARYPVEMSDYADFDGLDADFKEHHTLFMVPTFQDLHNPQVHWDFDPWHWGNNNCLPTTMSQWLASGPKPFGNNNSLIFSVNEDQYFRSSNGSLTIGLNHGDLIPPYPATGTGF